MALLLIFEMEQLTNFNSCYRKVSCLGSVLFTWCSPIIAYINKTKSLQDACQCVEMPESHSTKFLTNRIVQNLYEMLDSPQFDYKWSIVKLVMKTFKVELIVIILLGCLVEFLSLGNVFLTSFLVDWIKDEDSPLWVGFLLAFVIGGILLTALILRQQYFFYGKIMGINLRKSISGMIYK